VRFVKTGYADQAVPAPHETGEEVILNTEMAKNLGFAKPGDIIGKTVKATIGIQRQPNLGRGPGGGGGRLFGGGGKGRGAPTSGAAPEAQKLPEVTSELKVVGLTERERAVFGNVGSQIYIPFGMALEHQRRFFEQVPMLALFRPPGYNAATVHLTSAKYLDAVEKAINGLGLRTISIASAISQLKRVFLVVDMLLAFVGSIGLAVSCLGITNTMGANGVRLNLVNYFADNVPSTDMPFTPPRIAQAASPFGS
jgi:ABC-type antimicrobial peptide transport system permease subunit